MAKRVDKKMERTFGVLTKVFLINFGDYNHFRSISWTREPMRRKCSWGILLDWSWDMLE